MLNNLLFAQPLADDYAELFRGLSDAELDALADSFSFEQCVVRESLRDQLVAGLDPRDVPSESTGRVQAS